MAFALLTQDSCLGVSWEWYTMQNNSPSVCPKKEKEKKKHLQHIAGAKKNKMNIVQ